MFLLAKAPRCNSKIEEEMERVKTSGGGGEEREEKEPARKHYEIDGSQSPTFSWDRQDIARLTVNGGHLDFQMYRGSGRRGL